jgi:gas vesicle structural protein
MNWVKGVAMNNNAVPVEDEENTLLELLDRLLNAGVVLCGDLVVSVADIELLYLRLQLTLSTVETARRAGWFVPTVSACNSQLEAQNV